MTLKTLDYAAIQKDITIAFDNAVMAAQPFYPELCTIVPSNSAEEKYAFLGGAPGVKEWLGPRVFEQMRASDFSVPNKHYENSMGIEKTKFRDDQTGLMKKAIEAFADEAAYHPDELLFEVVAAAGSTPCFDTQYFFDTDHSFGDSGSQSNLLTYAAATGTAPTAAEFKASFHQALLAMLAFKNDRAKFMNRPRIGKLGNLVCVVPLAMYEAAVTAFEQIVIGSGETNVVLEKPTIIPCVYMSNAAVWDLYYTGGRIKPYVFQAREPISRETKGGESIEFKELKLMTEARYAVGCLAWWTAIRTTFT